MTEVVSLRPWYRAAGQQPVATSEYTMTQWYCAETKNEIAPMQGRRGGSVTSWGWRILRVSSSSAPADQFQWSNDILSSSSHIITNGNYSSDFVPRAAMPLPLFLNFELFSFILVCCRQMISTRADYTKGLLQVRLLVQFCFGVS